MIHLPSDRCHDVGVRSTDRAQMALPPSCAIGQRIRRSSADLRHARAWREVGSAHRSGDTGSVPQRRSDLEQMGWSCSIIARWSWPAPRMKRPFAASGPSQSSRHASPHSKDAPLLSRRQGRSSSWPVREPVAARPLAARDVCRRQTSDVRSARVECARTHVAGCSSRCARTAAACSLIRGSSSDSSTPRAAVGQASLNRSICLVSR
jgi:hypothetical protein